MVGDKGGQHACNVLITKINFKLGEPGTLFSSKALRKELDPHIEEANQKTLDEILKTPFEFQA